MSKSSQDSRWPRRFAEIGPLLFSFLLLSASLAYLYMAILKGSGGHFGYPMDDTYIHMAMARSFSQHGVWGLTHYAFSSTSSSLLYTFLLSLVYAIAGVREIAPLVMNIVFAFLLLYVCDRVLKNFQVLAWPRVFILILIVFGMPLAPETMAGMEHILHTVLTIAFAYCAVCLLVSQSFSRVKGYGLMLLGALTILARYEGLALVFVAAIFFFLRGKRWYALALFAGASIPIALFGAYSVSKGWFPVPNSIIAKVSRPDKSGVPFPIHWIEQLYATPSVAFLVVAGGVLFFLVYKQKTSMWNVECLTLGLFLPTALLHMEFARVGWFYRYEAYLVVLGLYACTLGMNSLRFSYDNMTSSRKNKRFVNQFALYGVFVAGAVISFESRAVGALVLAPGACRNIYEQQYQMGRFLKQSYPAVSVVMNDIGAAGYLSDSKIVDLYGLATVEVARAKIRHQFTQEFRRTLAIQTDSKIAIVYPGMYKDVGGLPPEWIQVGAWRIQHNVICWGDTVVFYAIDPAYRQKLIADLRMFEGKLPEDVIQTGLYMQSSKTD